ncbi:MAG TPA: hypothetical protein VG722_13185 [Tepidisphaeraceae bacterium]|nr:hypothetical protein [Tepidisphaeraceae bacterium]
MNSSRNLRCSILALAAGCVLAMGSLVHATTIANLATGLDGSGNLIGSGGVTDANWTSTVDATYDSDGSTQTVFSNNADWFGGWLSNGPNSDWIARRANVTDNGPAPYSFARTFSLTGYDLSSVTISGSWTLDDQGTLSINGHQISSLGNSNWGSMHSFTVPNADLVQGTNSLVITITSDDRFLEGVRLEGLVTGTAAVPLPAAAYGGLTLLGLLSIRSRKQRA